MKPLRNILLAASLLVAGIAHAQSLGTGVDPVQYIVAPETPGPHEKVNITVQGVGTFLGDANVTWSVNGAMAQQGTGSSSFSFTTGNLGQQTTVKLTINSATQGTITHLFTFIPSTIDLVWEANTSVPPLYHGHALYSAGSDLKIVAFPTVIVSGKKVAPQSLSYQWSVNDTPVPASSGTGKYVLQETGDQLQTGENISLDVFFGTLKVGHADLAIPAAQPEILLYNKDALRGVVWDQALPAGINMNAPDLTLVAQPYFFANNGAWNWNWSMNGTAVSGADSDKGILQISQRGVGQGSAQVSVSLQNLAGTQLVQSAQALLMVVFGQKATGVSNFFGI